MKQVSMGIRDGALMCMCVREWGYTPTYVEGKGQPPCCLLGLFGFQFYF